MPYKKNQMSRRYTPPPQSCSNIRFPDQLDLGVPCRNCALSSSPCIFPPSRKNRSLSGQQYPFLPVGAFAGDPLFNPVLNGATTISTIGPYRRIEKDFNSGRSANGQDGHRTPTYRGNPGCPSFVEQFVTWIAIQRSQLMTYDDSSFDPSWAAWGHSNFDLTDSALEISIDTVLSRPPVNSRASKPVKIRLPPYNHSIHLIQVLESAIGHEQHYFRRRDLRAKVAQMHQSPESPQSKDQGWLCHWLAVLALGELHSTDKETQVDPLDPLGSAMPISEGTVEPPGAEYYHQSVSLLQQVAENPDVQYIETLCILALYAFSMNRVNTAYMYVGVGMRAALSLDLHRSPQDFPSERSNLPADEIEHQKRLFWTVYYQDLYVTLPSGPASLNAALIRRHLD